MAIDLRTWLRALALGLLTTGLIACGGGGDDDDEEEEVVEDEDPTGLWLGTFTQAGASRGFGVMVAPNGQFVGVVANTSGTNGRLLIGTGDATQNALNASGTVFAPLGATLPNGQTSAALSVSGGRVTERVSMSGSYSGGGETATFALNFDPKTTRGASLQTLAGTYSLTPVPTDANLNATLTINTSGVATYATGAGCTGNGNFAVINPALNMYTYTLTIGACGTAAEYTTSGLAALNDSSSGGTNNLITVLGATAARDRGFAFLGTK